MTNTTAITMDNLADAFLDIFQKSGSSDPYLQAAKAQQIMKDAIQNPVEGEDAIKKGFVTSGSPTSGLTYYDLEDGAKLLYPVITPLRNSIPRVSGAGGIQANWRAITGINTNNVTFGVTQGNRAPVITTSTKDYSAVYRSYGLDDFVTYEAEWAGEGFDDIRSLAMMGLLRSLMIQEEKIIIGANTSIALGTTGTPVLSSASTGGTIAAGTYDVIAVALTYEGYLKSSVSGGLSTQVVRTLADGTTETDYPGTAIKSAASSTVTVSGSTSTITASVAAKTGAVAYAWFLGTAGNEVLCAITTTNSVTLTATGVGTQTAAGNFTADYSQNPMIFDGMFSQIYAANSGAYTNTFAAGATLTADGSGAIVEIDAALQSFWDNYRLSVDTIWVSSQQQKNITQKILVGSAIAAQRFMISTEQGRVKGGDLAVSYLNKFSMDGAVEIPIRLHPNIPSGMILFTTSKLPYPLSNVRNVLQMRMQRDFYGTAWPQRKRQWEYGIYATGVLQNYFPPAFGLINNITAG